MPACVALIAVWALVFGALGFLAVAFVEARSVDERNPFRYLRKSKSQSQSDYLRSKLWKPLLGASCAAVLAGGSAAEVVIGGLGAELEKHPVLTSAVTGAVLAIIVVLVIEALFKMVATTAWEGSLRNTWMSVVRGGRRGAHDLHKSWGLGDDARLTVSDVPESGKAAAPSYEIAQTLWSSLETRVTNASVAAFASEHPELGESMHRLATSADALQRGLERYSTRTPSHTGKPRTADDIVQMWRDYVMCLLDVDERGRSLKFESPMSDQSRDWLQRESAGHEPSPWLKRAMANAAQKTSESRTSSSGPE